MGIAPSVDSTLSSFDSPSGMIDEQIGAVYRDVQSVAEHITDIEAVAANLSQLEDKVAISTFHTFNLTDGKISFIEIGGVGGGRVGIGADDTVSQWPYFSFANEAGTDYGLFGTLSPNGRLSITGSKAWEFSEHPYVGNDKIITTGDFPRLWVENIIGIAMGAGKTAAQRTANRQLVNALLATGAVLWMRQGSILEIDESLLLADNSGLIGEDGPQKPVIYMPAAQFTNTNNSVVSGLWAADTRYGVNAVGLNLSGELGAPYTPRKNVVINRICIKSETTMGRYVRGIVGLNIQNCYILDVEVTGIPTGIGICLASAIECIVSKPYIHDFNDTTTVLVDPQSTAIEIDNDTVNGVTSARVRINDFRIYFIWGGGNLLTASGLQTDGINICKTGANVDIGNGYICKVGEGIDTFGSGTIGNVRLEDCYNFGLKMIHGASRITCGIITIIRPGIAGVCFMGSSDVAQDTEHNSIASLSVKDVDPDGVWVGEDTACVLFDDNGGALGKPRNNLIGIANLDPGAKGKYCWLDRSTGSKNRGQMINFVPGAALLRRVYIPNNAGSVKSTEDVYFKATGIGAVIPTAIDTNVSWGTEAEDIQGLHALNSDAVIVPYSGWYDVSTHLQYDVNPTGVRITQITVNGVARAARDRRPAVAGREVTTDLRERILLTAGDAVRVTAYQDSGGNLSINGANSWLSVELIREV